MARYTGPKCKLCRREGEKLFLKGMRCMTAKCAIAKRAYPPGDRKFKRRSKPSDYGKQLREKQKAKRSYGVLERQFRRYYHIAERQGGDTGENLMRLLERRLDNVLYLAGFAPSRAAARQLVTHGHVEIRGKKADIPSMLLRAGDVVKVRKGERRKKLIEDYRQMTTERGIPPWIAVNPDELSVQVLALPKPEEFSVPVRSNLIVELCSK
ncbi:MAG: 30S ribosomal protein S4 [Planctomycetota bacterium]|nr:MAG: 30S ribosomal protein S4 [Planctomycetota bacterium]